jgi:hypothetical protein
MNSHVLDCALAIPFAGSTSISQGFTQQLNMASESPASNPVFVPKSPQERAAFNAAANQGGSQGQRPGERDAHMRLSWLELPVIPAA